MRTDEEMREEDGQHHDKMIQENIRLRHEIDDLWREIRRLRKANTYKGGGPMSAEKVYVHTGMCPWCTKTGGVLVPIQGYEQWRQGELIQQAMPEVSPGDRERLISGTCPSCWDRVMGEEVES